LLGELAEKVKLAKTQVNSIQAKRLIALIDDVMPGHEIIAELNSVVKAMPKSGHVIKDSNGLRSVVVLPETVNGKGLINYALAVNETEISWQLFDEFVAATGHEIKRCKSETGANMIFSQRNYAKPGFATTLASPVVCVTWQDANIFITWYNQLTNEKYRLPSELEWRHLIKLSGIKVPDCGSSNLAGTELIGTTEDIKPQPCNDHHAYVAPFSAFKKNPLGLIGFHGNVAEWLAGCQAMGKFKAIFNADDQCESNPSAGYSWLSGVDDTGYIKQIKFDQAWSHIGFRLVKNIN
jgi:formylglycine-generating enzyme required for sulfatase activity